MTCSELPNKYANHQLLLLQSLVLAEVLLFGSRQRVAFNTIWLSSKHWLQSIAHLQVAASMQIYENELRKFQMDLLVITKIRRVQVKDMYWQACLVVLIVAVFNPSTIGQFVWESIPSLRSLMEVLIAGDRAFQFNRLTIPSYSFLVLG